jgi:penicillin G amidase
MMRLVVRFFGYLLLLALVGVAGTYLWLLSSLPQTDGTIALAGPTDEIRITRDAAGIPTISAKNDRDTAFGLGFIHAQDRLFQMDLMRHYGAGRLAEWFGTRAVPTDRSTRTLGLYRAAEAQYALLSPELRGVFDAYAAGVNAFLASRSGALPPEYVVLGLRPEPWRPADSLVWGKIMDLQLTGNYRFQLARAKLAKRLKPDELAVLYPAYRDDAPIVLGDLDATLQGLPPQEPASNEWVVDGKHSASGKPLLANDTHLGFSTPGVWYLARIVTPDDTLAGLTSPGEPLLILGHNSHIAWGFTTTGGDVDDLFVETVDSDHPNQYLAPGGSRAFDTREERILVAKGDPVTITVRATRHGPVISDGEPNGSGEVLALSTTWLQGEDRTPQALWDAAHAHDWNSFRKAFRNAVAPEQNIAYADIDGNIGFFAPAQVPIRAKGDGFLPAPGSTADNDWTGFIPFDALPSGFNPPSGRFVAANNKIVADSYPYLITRDWELPYRAERIGELLDATPIQTPDASAAMQHDTVSLMARRLLPLMLKSQPTSAAGIEARRRLSQWNERMDRRRVEPLLFTAWLREFNRQILAEKLGTLFEDYWALHPDVIENILTAHTDWCDNHETADVETCAQQLAAALDRAVAELSQRYGSDMNAWSWGRAHAASFSHPIWAQLPVIGNWLQLEIPDDGAFDTIDNATSIVRDEAKPFTAVHGPTMRMIVDLAAPDEARFMITPGQSGDLFSPHYGDLMEKWRDVTYLRFSGDESGGVLVLKPR